MIKNMDNRMFPHTQVFAQVHVMHRHPDPDPADPPNPIRARGPLRTSATTTSHKLHQQPFYSKDTGFYFDCAHTAKFADDGIGPRHELLVCAPLASCRYPVVVAQSRLQTPDPVFAWMEVHAPSQLPRQNFISTSVKYFG
jgi:hypothetical protein